MKPIMFNSEMVQAILDGRKTQTRKAIKLPHNNFRFDCFNDKFDDFSEAIFYDKNKDDYLKVNNKIDVGDILYVRERFLKITNVRVERLQDISNISIDEEGFHAPVPNMWSEKSREDYAKREFIKTWNSTAKQCYKWEDNPYVFVYDFEIVEK